MSTEQSVLVVAGENVDSPGLIEALRRLQEAIPTRLTLLVPVTPTGSAWTTEMAAGWPEAVSRAEHAARMMKEAGLELEEAIVGDPDPVAAVGDAMHCRDFDEVVLVVQ